MPSEGVWIVLRNAIALPRVILGGLPESRTWDRYSMM